MKLKKLKLKKWIIYLFFIIFLCVFTFSAYKIVKWIIDGVKTKELTNDINKETEIIETSGSSAINVNPPEDKKSDYWEFIKQDFISVDFNNLKERNSDTIGWIHVNNTNINYPIVQTDNNELYLDHAFDRSYNDSGWIFMDYRNDSSMNDTNTVIYGHSMKNKTMFGSLLSARNSSWYTNKDNWIIKLSTPTENTIWQIFSIYAIAEEGYYITTNFGSDTDIQNFFNTLESRSKYDFNVELIPSDKIITLSTCNTSSGDERLVVHAKLIKKEAR